MKSFVKTIILLTALLPYVTVAAQSASAADSAAAQVTSLPDTMQEVLTKGMAAGAGNPADSVTDAEAIAAQADKAYAADQYMLAEELYIKAMNEGGSSSVLFYNLGNTYYRQGFLGKAVVCYERALKLDPTNADARRNLEFVNSRITDKQIDSGSYMQSVWDGTVGMFHPDTWAVIALVLFAIFLGAVAVYIFSSAVVLKKTSFFGGLIVFLLTAGAVIISFAAANRVNSDRYAVILAPSSQLSTSPREARTASEEAFTLHEGTKVEILDSVSSQADGKWYEIMVGHGERAWVKAQDVERI